MALTAQTRSSQTSEYSGLLNPGGPIAQSQRNRCSISRVEMISASGVLIYADGKSRKDYRQNAVLLLLVEYFVWLKTLYSEKGSKLEDAVRYSLNQKQQLMAFLDYGYKRYN